MTRGRRISLAKFGRKEHRNYVVEESDDGEIHLIPAKIMTEREAALLANPEALIAVRRGIEQAKAGKHSVLEFDIADDID